MLTCRWVDPEAATSSALVVPAIVTTMMAAVMMVIVMPIVMAAIDSVVPGPPIAIGRVEPRHINERRRRIAIVFATTMAAAGTMAMSVPARVYELDQI